MLHPLQKIIEEMNVPPCVLETTDLATLRPNGAQCQTCKGVGFLRQDVDIYDERFGKLIHCPDCQMIQEEIKSRQASMLNTASMESLRAKQKTFQNFETRNGSKDAYRAAINFTRNPVKWVYLWGGTGNGKSHLSAAVKNALVAAGQTVIMQTWPQLVEELRKSFNGGNHSQVFETIQTVDVLVLDDLLAERSTEYVLERLFLLIDYRYNNFLPTFITSNFAPDKISEFRVASRLQDVELVTVVHNAANDYRVRY